MNAMQPVSQRILSCFATGLGLPDDYFEEVRCSSARLSAAAADVTCSGGVEACSRLLWCSAVTLLT